MKRVYLAAKYSSNKQMREYRQTLIQYDIAVTSRWIDQHGGDQSESAGPSSLNIAPHMYVRFAAADVQDIMDADTLIFFSQGDGRESKGGRHTKLGIAIGLGKSIVIIGPRENVFHCIPTITHCYSWFEFERWLAKERTEDVWPYGQKEQ